MGEFSEKANGARPGLPYMCLYASSRQNSAICRTGAAFAFNKAFSVRLSINNLFNDEGLSEGDPRGGSNVLDPTVSFFNGRPIQPRTITGVVTYRF